jgi:hypothetical protein
MKTIHDLFRNFRENSAPEGYHALWLPDNLFLWIGTRTDKLEQGASANKSIRQG